MQVIVTYGFFARHWELVTANLSRTTAGQIALVTEEFATAADPDAREATLERSLATLDLSVRFEPDEDVPDRNKLSAFNLYNETFEAELRDKLGDRPLWINTQSWPGYVEVRVGVADGYLGFYALRDRVFATTGPIFIAWLVGTTLLIGWIAIIFMRNQVRSILRLADAAEAFGRGREAPGFRPTGATEVRRAGRAFIAMRERIKRHMDQRATMLAGVSHDLRTPLTRMKLALAMAPSPDDLDALRADVEEMEAMVEAYLDFARDAQSDEASARIDMADLLREVAGAADPTGARITLDCEDGIVVDGRVSEIRRAAANLVGNALKFADKAWIAAKRDGVFVDMTIDDDGPGVDPARYEDAFKPFERLDAARAGPSGAGLGLAVVRDVARRHGGEISLAKAPQGGLRARLRLPG
ncbi:MAG: ATP-binding protein [Parvularculaceae bacterium]